MTESNLLICPDADMCDNKLCEHRQPHEFRKIISPCDKSCSWGRKPDRTEPGPCLEWEDMSMPVIKFKDKDFLI